MMDEYTYGVPQKYDPNSRMLARKVDKVQYITNVLNPIIQQILHQQIVFVQSVTNKTFVRTIDTFSVNF